MAYDSEYGDNMDYIRKEMKLLESTSIYEVVGRFVEAYKFLKETKELKEISKGEKNVKRRKPGS